MTIKNNKSVFKYIAPRYIREDEHWGADLDLIKISINELLLKKRRTIKYLDIGCGPGFHIVTIGKIYPEVAITGIDYSSKMLAETQKEIRVNNLKNVKLIKNNIITLKDEEKYDIITFLNNGFGNLYREKIPPSRVRIEVSKKIHKLLSDDGYLILSVYNREKLSKQYGENLKILEEKSNFKQGDLFVEYNISGTFVNYYSHWFSKKELYTLLRESEFKIDFFEKRISRLLLRATLA